MPGSSKHTHTHTRTHTHTGAGAGAVTGTGTSVVGGAPTAAEIHLDLLEHVCGMMLPFLCKVGGYSSVSKSIRGTSRRCGATASISPHLWAQTLDGPGRGKSLMLVQAGIFPHTPSHRACAPVLAHSLTWHMMDSRRWEKKRQTSDSDSMTLKSTTCNTR